MRLLTALSAVIARVLQWWDSLEDMCPESADGQHSYLHERHDGGWRLRCLDCDRTTKGLEVFARKG